jgi:hypothetical protein
MPIRMNTKYLRRYTSLPVLLDMLINKRITLLDPVSWEDRNDSFYIENYREIKGLKTVLALCFTERAETFHHWKVFAGDSSGVCIRFYRKGLLSCFKDKNGIHSGSVAYSLMSDLQAKPPRLEKLPFLKRKQYEDEAEFRIIYENRNKIHRTKDFSLDLTSIDRITLSPWMPPPIAQTVKQLISGLPGCTKIELIRTGVVESSAWQKILKGLA